MLMPLAYIPGRRSSNVGQFKVGWKFSLGFLNWVILGLFCLFRSFQANNKKIKQINVKIVHPVSGAGIQSHNLLNMVYYDNN